jgi:acyl-CoA synthetase (AMP-forming)/AMP-acid ligase II
MQVYYEGLDEYKEVAGRLACLAIAPWFHVLGLVNVVMTILTGESTVVFLPKFEPESYLQCIEVRNVECMLCWLQVLVFESFFIC